MSAWAGGASTAAAAESAAASAVTFKGFTGVPPSISPRRLTIKSLRSPELASIDDGRFLALRDRSGELLLVADPLELLECLVQAGAEARPRSERRRQLTHALDDADGLVVDGSFGVTA